MTEKKNIHQRIAEVMGEISYVQKDQPKGMNYSIVSHDKVTALVRPALLASGVTYYPVAMNRNQSGNRTELDITVRFTNVDDPADFIDVVSCGYGVDNQDKGTGKAMSYAMKYALLKTFGLETGDDADFGNEDFQSQQKMDAEREASEKKIKKAEEDKAKAEAWAAKTPDEKADTIKNYLPNTMTIAAWQKLEDKISTFKDELSETKWAELGKAMEARFEHLSHEKEKAA